MEPEHFLLKHKIPLDEFSLIKKKKFKHGHITRPSLGPKYQARLVVHTQYVIGTFM